MHQHPRSIANFVTETRLCLDRRTEKAEVLDWQEEGRRLAGREAAVDVVKRVACGIWEDWHEKTANKVNNIKTWNQLQGMGRMAGW